MKKVMSLLFLSMLFLQHVNGQESAKKTMYIKGYLMLVKQNNELEEMIFLPYEKACPKYSFKKLSKIKGYLIRGQNSHEIYLAEQASKKYDVSIPTYKNDNSRSLSPRELYITAVELKYWKTVEGKLKEDSGIPFIFKGKQYVINYVDDWDVAIEDVKIID